VVSGEWSGPPLTTHHSPLTTPKLTDFGLAKFTQEATHHTRTGALLGTPAYMAPEQADSRLADIGPHTDVYALGVVLYEILTARPPFQGSNDVDTVHQVLTAEPLAPRRLRPDVPRDLETICVKCLEKEPTRRYVSAAQLTEDLRAYQAGRPIRARPVTVWERAAKWARRRPAVAALAGVTAAALLCLAGWAFWYTVQLREHTTNLQNALNRAEAGERRLLEENYAIQIKLADTMQGNDPSGLLGDLVNRLRPGTDATDLRGFEWYYLWNVAHRELRLRGHRASISTVAFSPDGSRCASSDGYGIILWDARTGAILKRWPVHDITLRALAFSSDGRELATGAWDGGRTSAEFIVWDIATLGEIAHLERDANCNVYTATIQSDGPLIAIAGYEGDKTHGMLGVWNRQTGHVQYLYREPDLTVTTLQFSPDGRTLAVGCLGGPSHIALHDLTSEQDRKLIPAHDHLITTLAFSPDGKFLASGSMDHLIKVWDLAGLRLHAARDANDLVSRVAFSPDGKLLAVASHPAKWPPYSDAVTLWNMPGVDRRAEALKPEVCPDPLAFSPDGRTIAAGCGDGQVHLWRPFAESAVSTLKAKGRKETWSVAFSPDGRTLAVGYDDQSVPNRDTLKLWDVATGRELADLRGHGAMVSSVTFAPDGQTLISAGYDWLIKIWDARSQKVIATLKGHTAPVKYVACAPDGQTLASAGYDGLMKVWDTATGQQRFSVGGRTDRVNAVAFAPDGNAVASADNAGELRIWDMGTGQAIREFGDASHLMALAYAPNGLVLATTNKDGIVKLHDLTRDSEPRSLIGHKGEARAVAFSPDGKTLATGGEDRTVRLWQVATGRELLVFKGLPHKVNSVAFSPDGCQLAAAIHEGSVRLWHAPRDE
jgi:WD40 repeat protein